MKKENICIGPCIIYYDGSCPFCHRYADYLLLKKKYHLELRDARTYKKEVMKLYRAGYNINSGMIVIHAGNTYHGVAGIIYIHALLRGTPSTLHPLLLPLGKFFYMCINYVRKGILFLQGKKDIIPSPSKN